MSKTAKYILIGLGAVILLVILALFFSGLLSSLNPKKSLEFYIPSGYSVTKEAEMRESDIGKLYETVLEKEDKSIRIIKSNKYPFDCEGTQKEMGGQEVCYFGVGENPNLPSDWSAVLWSYGSYDYQLTTDDTALNEAELTKLIKAQSMF